MGPLPRRTWAPQGAGPALLQKGGHREKVSVAAALCLNPARDRLSLVTRARVNGYFNNEAVAAFLKGLLRRLGGAAAVVWDGGTMHKGDPIRDAVAASKGRLSLERLPPYGSELMPVEQLWAWLKYGRLSNFAPADANDLDRAVRKELRAIRGDQQRLMNFFHASRLPLPRALLM
jgi:putative transposase